MVAGEGEDASKTELTLCWHLITNAKCESRAVRYYTLRKLFALPAASTPLAVQMSMAPFLKLSFAVPMLVEMLTSQTASTADNSQASYTYNWHRKPWETWRPGRTWKSWGDLGDLG